ncbi:MAG: S-layer homology domain-containing protein [Clostridia bacterium]|nr:S-layer homology domain-containing protein [Clostridia bacterium]
MKIKRNVALVLILTLLFTSIPAFAVSDKTSSEGLFVALYSKFKTVITERDNLIDTYLVFRVLKGNGLFLKLEETVDELDPTEKALITSYGLTANEIKQEMDYFFNLLPSVEEVLNGTSESSNIFVRMYKERDDLSSKYFDYAPELKEIARGMYNQMPQQVLDEINALDVNGYGEVVIFSRLLKSIIDDQLGSAKYNTFTKEYYDFDLRVEAATKNKLLDELKVIAGENYNTDKLEELAGVFFGLTNVMLKASEREIENQNAVNSACRVLEAAKLIDVQDVTPESDIELSANQVRLEVGSNAVNTSYQIIASASNVNSPVFTYESEDTNIASVSNTGLISAKNSGTTKIIVGIQGRSETAELRVTVQVNNGNGGGPVVVPVVPQANIKLTNKEILLEVGLGAEDISYQLKPVVTNSTAKVLYSTSDENVVKVSSAGLIEAVGAGSAVITATLEGTDISDSVDVVVFLIDEEVAPLGSVTFLQPYISGYQDGTFRPDASVTRAEVAAMFAKVLGYNTDPIGTQTYSDVSDAHWAFGVIQAISRHGLFSGYEDGTFKPDEPITRAEIMAVFSNYWTTAGIVIDDSSNHYIKDVSTSHWALKFINKAFNANLVSGYADNSFKPEQNASRAEMVVMINKLLGRADLVKDKSSFKDISVIHWARHAIEAASSIQVEKNNLDE